MVTFNNQKLFIFFLGELKIIHLTLITHKKFHSKYQKKKKIIAYRLFVYPIGVNLPFWTSLGPLTQTNNPSNLCVEKSI